MHARYSQPRESAHWEYHASECARNNIVKMKLRARLAARTSASRSSVFELIPRESYNFRERNRRVGARVAVLSRSRVPSRKTRRRLNLERRINHREVRLRTAQRIPANPGKLTVICAAIN